MSLLINPTGGYLGINSGTTGTANGVGITGNVTINGFLTVLSNVNIPKSLIISNALVGNSSNYSIFNYYNSGNLSIGNYLNSANLSSSSNIKSNFLTVKNNVTVSSNISTQYVNCSGNLNILGNVNSTYINISTYTLLPIGAIFMWTTSSMPNGWLLCDGTGYTITSYYSLYTIIGSNYKTETSTLFYLPDLRNRFPMAAKTGTYNLGVASGSSSVALSYQNLPSHTHSVTLATSSHTHTFNGHTHTWGFSPGNQNDTNYQIGGSQFDSSGVTQFSAYNDLSNDVTCTTGDSGSLTCSTATSSISASLDNGSTTLTGSSFSVLQPYFAINFIIKY